MRPNRLRRLNSFTRGLFRLSENTIRKVMPSCMVYALVQSMTFMVDTILAGQYLGSDAVAGVALGMPIIGLMLSFTGMILQGGFLKMLDAMGRSNTEEYRRLYSVTLTFTFIVDFIFLAICLFGTDSVLAVAGGAKASEQAVNLGRLYIRTGCLMILFFTMGSLFQIVMATYGYQTDRMICSIVCVLVNLASSMLFISLLPEDIKIAGLGIGSALGTLAQMIAAFVLTSQRGTTSNFPFHSSCFFNANSFLSIMSSILISSDTFGSELNVSV